MKVPMFCPHCKADLRQELSPHLKKERPSEKFATKAIGWIDRDQDRLVEWECCFCKKRWKRED